MKNILNLLHQEKNEKYQKFASSLLPNTNNVLGVKLPTLKKIAKDIIKNNKTDYFLSNNKDEFFELTLIEAFIIGNLKIKFSEKLKLIKNFIPKITNWSICDSLCASLKEIKDNKEETKIFIEKYFKSNKEYELRFCFVILLNYFIDSDFDYVIQKISDFNNNKYYAKMAVAWALSYCFIFNYNKTLKLMSSLKTPKDVIKKGITKAIESKQISTEQKEELKSLRLNFS